MSKNQEKLKGEVKKTHKSREYKEKGEETHHKEKERVNKRKETEDERKERKRREKHDVDKRKEQDNEKSRHKTKEDDKNRNKENGKNQEKDTNKDKENGKNKEKENGKNKERDKHKDREKDRDVEKNEQRSKERDKRHKERDREESNDKKHSQKRKEKKDQSEHKKHDERAEDKENTSSKTHNENQHQKEEVKDGKEENEDDYDYEDDFENYDDDFEDEDEDDEDDEEKGSSDDGGKKENKDGQDKGKRSMLDDLQRSIDEENKKLIYGSKEAKEGQAEEKEGKFDSMFKEVKVPNFFINFSKDQHHQPMCVSMAMRKRAMDLSRWIELDQSTTFNLFYLPPQQLCKKSNSFVITQTRDDDVERGMQTDSIDTTNQCTQHPPVITLHANEEDESGGKDDFVYFSDAISLGKFVSNSVPLVIELLEEGRMLATHSFGSRSDLGICDSLFNLKVPEILKGRPIEKCTFSNSCPHWLLTLHSSPAQLDSEADWSLRGVICVWNLYTPDVPTRILTCLAELTCCCFCPEKATMVFAGTDDGSVLLWDLKRPTILKKQEWNKGGHIFLTPSYNTIFTKFDKHSSSLHSSSVVSMATIQPNKLDFETKPDEDDYQLVTLEENSIIFIWTPMNVEEDEHDDEDNHQAIFNSNESLYRLIKNYAIPLFPFDQCSFVSWESYQMAISASHQNHIFTSCGNGRILHVLKNNYTRTSAKSYRALEGNIVELSSIDVSNTDPQLILAGYVDGSLRIFNVHSSYPVFDLKSENQEAILFASWNASNFNSFLVIDHSNQLHLWDLLVNTEKPVESFKLNHKSNIRSAQISKAASKDGSAHNQLQFMAICYEDGDNEIRKMSKEFTLSNETKATDILKLFKP